MVYLSPKVTNITLFICVNGNIFFIPWARHYLPTKFASYSMPISKNRGNKSQSVIIDIIKFLTKYFCNIGWIAGLKYYQYVHQKVSFIIYRHPLRGIATYCGWRVLIMTTKQRNYIFLKIFINLPVSWLKCIVNKNSI